MPTVICPRCQTASPATVPEGQPVECPCCKLTFSAVHNADLPSAKQNQKWVIVALVAIVALAIVGIAAFGVYEILGQLLIGAVGIFAGLALFLLSFIVVVLWIAFPVFSYVYLRDIRDSLRLIAANSRLRG